jgi:serine O-acetyltransferase
MCTLGGDKERSQRMSWFKKGIEAAKKNDPAARSTMEIVLTYPGFHALFWHRVSHVLYRRHFYLLAKMHAQFWRFITGVEIHPGAKIAAGVFIDHGMGVVIGETAEIEEDVVLFHGVTLGGTGKDHGKRHPTVKKGALISANAQILGPITIGEKAKIGASAVVIKDIPDGATAVGIPAKVVRINGEKVRNTDDSNL